MNENIKSSRHWSLCREFIIHRWPLNSTHKWPVTRKMFPFDDVIMLVTRNTVRVWYLTLIAGTGSDNNNIYEKYARAILLCLVLILHGGFMWFICRHSSRVPHNCRSGARQLCPDFCLSSGQTFCHQISWSIEATGTGVKTAASPWNLTCTPATLLPRPLPISSRIGISRDQVIRRLTTSRSETQKNGKACEWNWQVQNYGKSQGTVRVRNWEFFSYWNVYMDK